MSWKIRVAHPLCLLADQWIDDWQSHIQQSADLFEPVRVIVPNRNLKRWMQMHASRRGLVVANLRFQYLEEGLRSLLEELDGGRLRVALLRRTERQSRILRHLNADLERDPGRTADQGGRIYRRLVGTERCSEKEERLRLYQLSARLSALFEDYEFHRPRSMHEWRSLRFPLDDRDLQAPLEAESAMPGGAAPDHAMFSQDSTGAAFSGRCMASEMGLEQRHLYSEIMHEFAAGERSDGRSDGLPRIAVAEYARRVLALNEPGSRDAVQSLTPPMDRRPVFLFGLSLLSRMHIDILEGLALYYDLQFYMLDVQPSLFDPVAGPVSHEEWIPVSVRKQHGSDDSVSEGSVRFKSGGVQSWHRPVGDLVQLLGPSGTWLQRPQRLQGSGAPTCRLSWLHERLRGESSSPAPDDGSLTVAACPGEWREIETIYQSILQRMDQDADLLLSDIAVLVPDMERYRPYILHVFDREIGSDGRRLIPYNLSDYSAAGESRYASGVHTLLDLMEGSFTRSLVFDLFLNPCFLARRRIDLETVKEWLGLVDDVRIHRLFDLEEREHISGTQRVGPRGDAFTWVRGLRRLYLGLYAGEGPIADMAPHPLLVGDRSSLLKLIENVDELHQGLVEVRRPEGTGRERLDRLLLFFDRFLRAPYDLAEEGKVAEAFIESIRGFDPELFREDTYLRQAVLASLAGIDGCRGQYLAGGVTICSLQPMRPVPFRHIYIAGLGEGQFPAKEDRSSLDLLWMDRQKKEGIPTGDSGLAEKARVLLLETLLSASDSIMLLYRGRDTTRDRDLLPSAPLAELMSFLGIRSRVQNVPLKLYSAKYLDPESGAGPNYSAFDLRLAFGSLPGEGAAQATGSAAAVPLRSERPTSLEVDVRHLVEFLRHPVEAVLRRRMGLFDSDLRDLALEDEEPFHPDTRDFYDFRREMERGMLRRLLAGDSALRQLRDDVLAEVSRAFALRDRLPLPPYDGVHLAEWREDEGLHLYENAATAMADFSHRAAKLGIGLPGDIEVPALELPVHIHGCAQTVRLVGELDSVCLDAPTIAESTRLAVLLLAPKGADSLKLAAALLPMIVLRCLSGVCRDRLRTSILVIRDGDPKSSAGTMDVYEFVLDVERGRAGLAALLEDFLSSDMEYLPFGLIDAAGLTGNLGDVPDSEIEERLRSAFVEGDYDRMLLMKLVTPRLSDGAVATLRRRWGMIFEALDAAVVQVVKGKGERRGDRQGKGERGGDSKAQGKGQGKGKRDARQGAAGEKE